MTSAKLFDLAGKRIYVAGQAEPSAPRSCAVSPSADATCCLPDAASSISSGWSRRNGSSPTPSPMSGAAHLNIGSGEEVTIAELARLVAEVVGYGGELAFDPARPDGMPRKLLDSSWLADLGWRARTSLRAGLERTYAAFLSGRYRDR